MKSWGERLIAGLKNWRSRKNDAVEAETPNARRLADTSTEQSDYETKIKLSMRAVSNEAIGESTQAAELESSDNRSATADQLKVPEEAPAQAELAPEQAEENPVQVSVSEQSLQRSKPRTLKTEENHVAETGEAGSLSDMENEGRDKPETPGQALQKEIPASVRLERAHKADGEEHGQATGVATQAAELANADCASATADELRMPEEAPEQAEGLPVPASVSEQSHKRSKPKTSKTVKNHVTETGEAGSTPDREIEGSDKPETPGHALQKEIPASARLEKAHKADSEIRGQIEPDTKPVTQLSIDEPLRQNQTAREDEIASIHAMSTVPNSLVRRSVARRSKNGSQSEAVTDEELEALEAENARLKRLLSDRKGAKSNTSDG